jgi:hypothetical protein
MGREWKARTYRDAYSGRRNDDRWELFVKNEKGDLVSIGGAISKLGFGKQCETIAFICEPKMQRDIVTFEHGRTKTGGRFVVGNHLIDALRMIKWKYPDPEKVIADAIAEAIASF